MTPNLLSTVSTVSTARSFVLGPVTGRMGEAASHPHLALAGLSGFTGLLADVPTMQPDSGQLPGGDLLRNLMDGLQYWALALALVALVIGAAAWALGAHSQNYQQSFVGRRTVLISGLAALLIGVGPELINFFYSTGHSITH